MLVKWRLDIGIAGAALEDEFEIDEDATDEEIEEAAKELVFGNIDWSWEKVN